MGDVFSLLDPEVRQQPSLPLPPCQWVSPYNCVIHDTRFFGKPPDFNAKAYEVFDYMRSVYSVLLHLINNHIKDLEQQQYPVSHFQITDFKFFVKAGDEIMRHEAHWKKYEEALQFHDVSLLNQKVQPSVENLQHQNVRDFHHQEIGIRLEDTPNLPVVINGPHPTISRFVHDGRGPLQQSRKDAPETGNRFPLQNSEIHGVSLRGRNDLLAIPHPRDARVPIPLRESKRFADDQALVTGMLQPQVQHTQNTPNLPTVMNKPSPIIPQSVHDVKVPLQQSRKDAPETGNRFPLQDSEIHGVSLRGRNDNLAISHSQRVRLPMASQDNTRYAEYLAELADVFQPQAPHTNQMSHRPLVLSTKIFDPAPDGHIHNLDPPKSTTTSISSSRSFRPPLSLMHLNPMDN